MYFPTSSPRLEETIAIHRCNTGYVLSGREVRTCQSDRTWSEVDITCLRKMLQIIMPGRILMTWFVFVLCVCIRYTQLIMYTATCTDLPHLTNGAIAYSPTSTPRLVRTTATFRCDNGYVLSGGTVRTCQSDRTWSRRSITCQRERKIVINNCFIEQTRPLAPGLFLYQVYYNRYSYWKTSHSIP